VIVDINLCAFWHLLVLDKPRNNANFARELFVQYLHCLQQSRLAFRTSSGTFVRALGFGDILIRFGDTLNIGANRKLV
tara:strand:- start:2136 stop:2369 length:234 start_codon:yes stop_codon:yes gene_type:complete